MIILKDKFTRILRNFLIILFLCQLFLISSSFADVSSQCKHVARELIGGTRGPSDYNNPLNRKHIIIVEKFHFTPQVEQLIKGSTDTHPPHDLNYTLKHFPNHHRALYSVIRYDLANRKPKLDKSAECYLTLALTFKPRDATVWMLFGLYYQRKLEFEKSLEKYQRSEKINPDNAQLHYNLGLLFLKKEDYKHALKHARKAYKLGIKLPGLKRKLIKAGKWNDKKLIKAI